MDAVFTRRTPPNKKARRYELAGEPKTIERFYHGEFVARAVAEFADRRMLSRSTRSGCVLEETVLDMQRFGDTVAVNRGMLVKTFDNLQDTLGWLGISPAKKPDAGDGK